MLVSFYSKQWVVCLSIVLDIWDSGIVIVWDNSWIKVWIIASIGKKLPLFFNFTAKNLISIVFGSPNLIPGLIDIQFLTST